MTNLTFSKDLILMVDPVHHANLIINDLLNSFATNKTPAQVLKEKIAQAEIHIAAMRGALIKLQEAITNLRLAFPNPSALMIEKIDLFTKETAKLELALLNLEIGFGRIKAIQERIASQGRD